MALDSQTIEQLEAASFRRLISHLQNNTEVQNIDLMILADFCRNCLSKWMVSSANELGVEFDYDQAREHVYGMPYSEWKGLHQQPATPEQVAAFNARQDAKQKG
ncbi:MAG: DUF1244 domain-containing protein [Myxococcota bacterium]